MTTTEREISDDLLAAFDSIVEQGTNLPIEEIRKRYKASDFLTYNAHKVFINVIELPVTLDMVLGRTSGPVEKVLDGLRELYGDDLEFTFGGRGDETQLVVRRWRADQVLRKVWREFAEDEYKTKTVAGAA